MRGRAIRLAPWMLSWCLMVSSAIVLGLLFASGT